MKLLPSILFIILLFLAGLLFLQWRRSPKKKNGLLSVPLILLLLLLGLAFIVVGKIALFIAIITILLFLIYPRARS